MATSHTCPFFFFSGIVQDKGKDKDKDGSFALKNKLQNFDTSATSHTRPFFFFSGIVQDKGKDKDKVCIFVLK